MPQKYYAYISSWLGLFQIPSYHYQKVRYFRGSRTKKARKALDVSKGTAQEYYPIHEFWPPSTDQTYENKAYDAPHDLLVAKLRWILVIAVFGP